MNQLVAYEVVAPRERTSTRVTLQRDDAPVDGGVTFQVVGAGETLVADAARELLVVAVDCGVTPHVVPAVKRLGAAFALERSFGSVNQDVVLDATLERKGFGTHAARERLV